MDSIQYKFWFHQLFAVTYALFLEIAVTKSSVSLYVVCMKLQSRSLFLVIVALLLFWWKVENNMFLNCVCISLGMFLPGMYFNFISSKIIIIRYVILTRNGKDITKKKNLNEPVGIANSS